MARSAAGLALAALALALTPVAAGAADYTVHSCAGQGGSSAGWHSSHHGGAPHPTNGCATGAGFAAQISGTRRATRRTTAGWTFRAPAGATISAVTLTRQVTAVAGYAYELVAHGAKVTVIERCDGPACAADRGPRTATLPPSTKSLTARVLCAHRCASTGQPTAASVTVSNADLTLADLVAPHVAIGPKGALFSNTLGAGGVRNFDLGAVDSGSGVSTVDVAVDGALLISYPVGTCQRPIVSPAPCPARAGLDLPLNTATLANGVHSMQVTVVDAAGNSATAPARFFSSYNAGQPGAYAWLDGSMHWHGHRGAAGLTVNYGARPTITGVLLGVDSKPLAGAPVVLSLEDDGAFAVRGQGTTDAQGHFTLQLPVTHSGEVRVSYGAAALKAFRLDVRAGVTLRASPRSLHNGQRVTFSGRVRSGPIPAAGALVQIQGLNGRRWQEIGTARATTGSGRYRLRFPFANVRRFTRFEFRAKVLREPEYPYATGFSAVRSVLVRP